MQGSQDVGDDRDDRTDADRRADGDGPVAGGGPPSRHGPGAGAEPEKVGQDPSADKPALLPDPLDSIAEVISGEAATPCIGRDAEVTEIIAGLGRSDPVTTVLVGPSGSGRTSVVRALAVRLAAHDYRGPLAGAQVIAVDPNKVLAREPAVTLQKAFDAACRLPETVVVLEDFEVLAGLSWGPARDHATLTVLRGALGRQGLRLLLVFNQRFVSHLIEHDADLGGRLNAVPIPPLSGPGLLEVGRTAATRLGAHHGTGVPDAVVAAAAAPTPEDHSPAHPAKLIERLDAACVRAVLQGRDEVAPGDLDLPEQREQREQGEQGATVGLAAFLRERIVGQDLAIERVTGRLALTRSEMDLQPERPDGVFLFVGPQGAGKKTLARALATALAGSPEALIRLDLEQAVDQYAVAGEFSQPSASAASSTTRMMAGPPTLSERVRAQPNAVIVLESIEQAHPWIRKLLLGMFDTGRLRGAAGVEADFSRTVVVLIADLDTPGRAGPGIGFTSGGEQDLGVSRIPHIRQVCPPELWSRIDDVILFERLSLQSIRDIAARELTEVCRKLAQRGILLEFDDAALAVVTERDYIPEFGARHLRRNLEQLVLQPGAQLPAGRYRINAADGGLAATPVA